MKKLLIDTSVIIDFLRRKDKEATLLYKISHNYLYMSIVTHTEIYSGKSVWEKEKAKEEVHELFSGLTILPLIPEISKVAGHVKAYNHDSSILDCIIAATALVHDIELATLNVKDFEKIKGIHLFNDLRN